LATFAGNPKIEYDGYFGEVDPHFGHTDPTGVLGFKEQYRLTILQIFS
jgi:hypothetical protein